MRSEAEHNQLVSDLSLRVDELEEALAAERERCAKIAEKEMAVAEANEWREYMRVDSNIAVQIRGGR